MTLTTDIIIRELRDMAELRAEQERYLYEDAAERPNPEDHIEWKGADELERLLTLLDKAGHWIHEKGDANDQPILTAIDETVRPSRDITP